MGTIVDQINTAFRDYATEGVASSGSHEVIKSDVRAIGPLVETAIANAGLGSLVDVTYATKAELDADLAHDADSVGLVYGDSTDANNDLYIKVGASGSGSWTLTTAFHDIVDGLTADAVAQAEAWAEGTEPGGVDTKSSKEWALEAEGSALVATSRQRPEERRERVIGKGLMDVSTWDNELDSGSAFAHPWPLPAGSMSRLRFVMSTNGSFDVFLATPQASGPWDCYWTDSIDGSAGGVIDEEYATPVEVKANSRLFIKCQNAGRIAMFQGSSTGGLPNGENPLDPLLPLGVYTMSGPAVGEKSVNFSSTARILAVEATINELLPPISDKTIADQEFNCSERPGGVLRSGTAWTFSAANGYAESNSSGITQHLKTDVTWCSDQRQISALLGFADANSATGFGTRPETGSYGTVMELDVNSGEWRIGTQAGGSSSFDLVETLSLPAGYDENSIFHASIQVGQRRFSFRLHDIVNGGRALYNYDVNTFDPADPQSPVAESLALGKLNGSMFVYNVAGGTRLYRWRDEVFDKHASLAIFGDSITGASRNDLEDGFADQVRQIRKAESGKLTSIHALDGASPGSLTELILNALSRMPYLEKVLIYGGTNTSSGDSTRDLNMFNAAANTSDLLLGWYGIEGVWLAPASHPFSPGATAAANYKGKLDDLNWRYIEADDVLTSDGTTIIPELFWNDGDSDVHPIAGGQTALVGLVRSEAVDLLM